MLIKMVLLQHLFGIPSLRQTHREIQVNNAYRWFLGYGLLEDIPHFATVAVGILCNIDHPKRVRKWLCKRTLQQIRIFVNGLLVMPIRLAAACL